MTDAQVSAHQSKVHGQPALLKPVHVGKAPSAIVIGLCKEHRIPAPLAEVEFHPLRKWMFDLAWVEDRIALEIEGGIWRKGGGAHSHPSNIERDIMKYNAATLLGWRVLRCAPEDLAEGILNVASLRLVPW